MFEEFLLEETLLVEVALGLDVLHCVVTGHLVHLSDSLGHDAGRTGGLRGTTTGLVLRAVLTTFALLTPRTGTLSDGRHSQGEVTVAVGVLGLEVPFQRQHVFCGLESVAVVVDSHVGTAGCDGV